MPRKPLTDAALRQIQRGDKLQVVSDLTVPGLSIHVPPATHSGGLLWRLRYRFDGKQKTLALGKYPETTLAEARGKAREARSLLAQGIDPSAKKKADKKAALTFREVAEQWLEKRKAETVPNTHKKLSLFLETACGYVGNEPLGNLQRESLVAAVQDIQSKKSVHLAHRVAGLFYRVCLYAWDCGYLDYNLADRLANTLNPYRATHRAAIIDPLEVGRLLLKIRAYQGMGFSVAYCLKIMPYLPLRSEELREAHWQEIDFESAAWTVPATRHEQGGGMKMREAHAVPLARQVVALLKELKSLQIATMGEGERVFPSPKNTQKAVSSEGLLNALKAIHGSNDISVHGFRTTFSTLARENGFNPEHIEKQLAHKEQNSVVEAYDRSTYFEQRRQLMQGWADYLDRLKGEATGNV